MSKFIELHYSVDDTLVTISADKIISFALIRKTDYNGNVVEDGTYLKLTDSHIHAKESYEEVKSLLDKGERDAITAEIIERALVAWREKPCDNCDDCKYKNETTGRCQANYVADYINNKLKGE